MLDISSAFPNSSESLVEFFKRSGVGYYIPLYQRQYSWDKENIDQLMEDICSGVKELVSDDRAIRFMGTVILFEEKDKDRNIEPKDRRALPPRIDNVIDGQQRISTTALLATQLYMRLHAVKDYFQKKGNYEDLIVEFDARLKDLLEMFSVDLQRGNPARKPIIIRGSIDQWTLDGDDDNYPSLVSSYLAKFIRSVKDNSTFPKADGDNLVHKNIKIMNHWLSKVEKSYEDSEIFPNANEILENIKEEYIWSYDRPEYSDDIKNSFPGYTSEQKRLCIAIQLLTFIHYFCRRACFTLIEPVSENWAFDMFQSLNASGTPLTSIETFKPLVVNDFDKSAGSRFKGHNVEGFFDTVENLLDESTASKKAKLTNEFLTTLALCHDGNKSGMSTQFSSQRSWLNFAYNPKSTIEEKEEFVFRMHNLATFWRNVVHFKPQMNLGITLLEGLPDEDRKIASLNCLYLKDANHKMAYTVLSRFYALVIRGVDGADKEFVEVTKCLAAFFTLWRSSSSNAGLDDVYRKLLRNNDKDGYRGLCWEGDAEKVKSIYVKDYLRKVLIDQKAIVDFETWYKKARENFTFDKAKKVCQYALLIAFHDTIPDKNHPGLMKKGTKGQHEYLTPSRWASDDLRTIEHVAPVKPPEQSDWDSKIYERDLFQSIGNLTLLPTSINSSIGNNSWVVKRIYYKHLAESDPDNLAELLTEARNLGVNLRIETVELLKNTSFKHHLNPILDMGPDNNMWTADLIEKRAQRICELVWGKLSGWIGFDN